MVDGSVLLLGGLVAVLSSLIGSFSGGGMSLIMFPLIFLLTSGPYVAALTVTKVATTTMTIISSRVHFRKGNIKWDLFLILTIFGVLGTAVGTYLIQYQLREQLFTFLLAVVLLSTAVYLLFFARQVGVQRGVARPITRWVEFQTAVFTFLINILNGLFGGMGLYMTLYLILVLRLTFIQATAYTFFSYVFVNLIQTGYLLMTTSVSISLLVAVVLGSLLGGWMGTHLQYLKGNVWVRRAAIIVMASIGVRILFQSLS